jgi:hypothetical protein
MIVESRLHTPSLSLITLLHEPLEHTVFYCLRALLILDLG